MLSLDKPHWHTAGQEQQQKLEISSDKQMMTYFPSKSDKLWNNHQVKQPQPHPEILNI